MDPQAQQIIGALQEQVALLTEAQNQQQQRMQEMQLTQLKLTPDQIIKNFNTIPLFSGEDSYKLRTFLKNVMFFQEQLCFDHINTELGLLVGLSGNKRFDHINTITGAVGKRP